MKTKIFLYKFLPITIFSLTTLIPVIFVDISLNSSKKNPDASSYILCGIISVLLCIVSGMLVGLIGLGRYSLLHRGYKDSIGTTMSIIIARYIIGELKSLSYFDYKDEVYMTCVDEDDDVRIYKLSQWGFGYDWVGYIKNTDDITQYQTKLVNTINKHIDLNIQHFLKLRRNKFKSFNNIK